MRIRALTLPALAAVCAAVACATREERSTQDTSSSTEASQAKYVQSPPMPASPAAAQARDEADFSGRGVAGGAAAAVGYATASSQAAPASTGTGALPTTPAGAQQPADATAMIIRTGYVTVQVDSLDAAVARVRAVAARVGGYVANTSFSGGDKQIKSATVEIKVPAARFDEALTGMRPIGKVEAENVQAQDVGEEFVDVTARVANAHRLEQRLVELLANRTGKLSDVLAVERELARVREEIERYEGRLRYLRARTAMSTLAVTVHEPPPVLAQQPGVNPIAEAFRDAWRNFVALSAGLIASLGVVIPVAVIAAAAWALWRKFGRATTLRTAAPEPRSEPAQ
jgi:Domain of unknown function (DUF4349)